MAKLYTTKYFIEIQDTVNILPISAQNVATKYFIQLSYTLLDLSLEDGGKVSLLILALKMPKYMPHLG